jgi:hypothetical protein
MVVRAAEPYYTGDVETTPPRHSGASWRTQQESTATAPGLHEFSPFKCVSFHLDDGSRGLRAEFGTKRAAGIVYRLRPMPRSASGSSRTIMDTRCACSWNGAPDNPVRDEAVTTGGAWLAKGGQPSRVSQHEPARPVPPMRSSDSSNQLQR